MHRRPPSSPLLPYTTLFRSGLAFDVLGQVFRHHAGKIDGARVLHRVGKDAARIVPHDAHRVSSRVRLSRSEEHTSELQSHSDLVCRLLLEKKKLQYLSWSAA